MNRSQARPMLSSDLAILAPFLPMFLVADSRISNTSTSNFPLSSTWPAIGSPISPHPTKPTFIMNSAPLNVDDPDHSTMRQGDTPGRSGRSRKRDHQLA